MWILYVVVGLETACVVLMMVGFVVMLIWMAVEDFKEWWQSRHIATEPPQTEGEG